MSPEEKKEKARESARASYNANKERYLERGRAWRAANKEKVKANNAAYHAANRERENARSRVARARANEARTLRLKRRVAWANAAAIVSFHREAQWLTESTGRLHVVDHIIPLKGRTVSGLDVANNLRVVEASANAHKTNKWESPRWERPCASSGDVPLASGDAPPSQLALF